MIGRILKSLFGSTRAVEYAYQIVPHFVGVFRAPDGSLVAGFVEAKEHDDKAGLPVRPSERVNLEQSIRALQNLANQGRSGIAGETLAREISAFQEGLAALDIAERNPHKFYPALPSRSEAAHSRTTSKRPVIFGSSHRGSLNFDR